MARFSKFTFLLLLAACASPARAQVAIDATQTAADIPVTAPQQADNPDDGLGLRLGSFLVSPELEQSLIFSTNPQRSASASESDIGYDLKPSLNFQSDWVRHALSGSANLSATRFFKTEDDAQYAGGANVNLRLDVISGTTLDLGLSYDVSSEQAETDLAGETATGFAYEQDFKATAALNRQLGSLGLRAGLGVARFMASAIDLASGGTVDNGDRNTTTFSSDLRLTYDAGARLKPFVGVVFDRRLYDDAVDRDGLRRSSYGLSGEIGVSLDDPLWSGSVALIGGVRDFEDALLETQGFAGLQMDLTWKPTEFTSFTLTSAVKQEEDAAPGIDATIVSNLDLSSRHGLRDNLDVLAGLSAELSAGQADDLTLGARLGLNWDVNRYLAWSAGYEGTWFNSGASDLDNYTEHRLLTTVKLRR
jgi:hypothetical protein